MFIFNKKKLYSFIVFVFVFFNITLVCADIKNTISDATKKVAEKSGLKVSDSDNIYLPALVGKYIQYLLSSLGVVFLALLIYGGFIWMNARGDDGEIQKAKNIIKNSAIGLIIVLSGYAISAYVVENLLKVTT